MYSLIHQAFVHNLIPWYPMRDLISMAPSLSISQERARRWYWWCKNFQNLLTKPTRLCGWRQPLSFALRMNGLSGCVLSGSIDPMNYLLVVNRITEKKRLSNQIGKILYLPIPSPDMLIQRTPTVYSNSVKLRAHVYSFFWIVMSLDTLWVRS